MQGRGVGLTGLGSWVGIRQWRLSGRAGVIGVEHPESILCSLRGPGEERPEDGEEPGEPQRACWECLYLLGRGNYRLWISVWKRLCHDAQLLPGRIEMVVAAGGGGEWQGGFISGLSGFPGGAVVKNPPASAGDTGSSPGQGRSHVPQSN